MANKALHLAVQLEKSKMIYDHIFQELHRRGFHPKVIENAQHDAARRSSGISSVEIIGNEWRKAHGFGRPFHSGNGGGKGAAAHQRRQAAEAAAQRRRQKAARVRGRIAQGMRSAAASIRRVVLRGSARNS